MTPSVTATQRAPFSYELRFPGQFFDQSTKLRYNYFRDYDPRTGRYIESDPIGLQGGDQHIWICKWESVELNGPGRTLSIWRLRPWRPRESGM
jgi:RHS repeat-associated protein